MVKEKTAARSLFYAKTFHNTFGTTQTPKQIRLVEREDSQHMQRTITK